MIPGYRVQFEFGPCTWTAILMEKPTWRRLSIIWQIIILESNAEAKNDSSVRRHATATMLLDNFGNEKGTVSSRGNMWLKNGSFCCFQWNKESIWKPTAKELRRIKREVLCPMKPRS